MGVQETRLRKQDRMGHRRLSISRAPKLANSISTTCMFQLCINRYIRQFQLPGHDLNSFRGSRFLHCDGDLSGDEFSRSLGLCKPRMGSMVVAAARQQTIPARR